VNGINTIIRADGLAPNTPRVACPACRQFPANLRGWSALRLSGRDTGTYRILGEEPSKVTMADKPGGTLDSNFSPNA
jgi:hypothetical protein